MSEPDWEKSQPDWENLVFLAEAHKKTLGRICKQSPKMPGSVKYTIQPTTNSSVKASLLQILKNAHKFIPSMKHTGGKRTRGKRTRGKRTKK